MYRLMAAIAAALLVSVSAFAQSPPPTTSYPAGWSPTGNTAALAVSNVSGRVVLGWVAAGPKAPPSVLVCNTGAVNAYVTLGGSTVTATTGGVLVAAGYCPLLALNGASYIAAITSSSTTNLSIMAGTGGSQSSLPGAGGPGSFMLSTGSNATSAAFGNLVSAAGSAATITLGSTPLTYGSATTTIAGLTLSGAILSTAPTLTGFTAGSVLFAGVGGVVSQDNNNLFFDDINNRLGIGTTGGGGLLGKLQVTTDSDTSNIVTSWDNRFFVVGGSGNSGGMSISYNQTTNTGLLKALSPNVAYRNIALNPDGGNVGIGNYIPAVALDVGATSAAMRVRNLFTDASNGEWFGISWSGSVVTIGAEKNGSGTVRAVTAVGASWTFTPAVIFSDTIKVSGDTTGAGTTAGFGANSPATTLTAPYTWLKFISSDGSTVYTAAYK